MLNKKSIVFRVYGTPRPVPTKKPGRKGKFGFQMIDDDYRTRKHPTIPNKKIKYDHGYKKKWMMHIQSSVAADMKKLNLLPFPMGHPVAIGVMFFMPRPKSNKSISPFPIKNSDRDNHNYAIWNALKRTPGTNVNGVSIPGKYPDGVVYYDDNQLVWGIRPEGWVWATAENPPGVLISIKDALLVEKEAFKQIEIATKRVEIC